MNSNMISIMFMLLNLSSQEVILIKGIPGCPPNRICEINGLDDVVANSSNLPYLITMLHNNCVESAAVAGWNDHICYDLVLRSNGALAPYVPTTNYADHAFCIPKGSGCNRGMYKKCKKEQSSKRYRCDSKPYPCPPAPKPYPCPPAPKPRPCPPAPKPRPCPPAPCPPEPYPCPPEPYPCPIKPYPCPIKPECSSSSESSSSSSESSKKCRESSSSSSSVCSERSSYSNKRMRNRKCPKYVKQKKVVYKGKKRASKCKDWVRCAIDSIKIVKTFIFNERDICDRRRVKIKEVTDKESKLIKWVELKPIFDGKRITKEGYPALLRFPVFLLEFKKYVERKHKYENVCLYLDCHGKLYVRVKDTLFLVKFKKNLKFSKKCAFKYVKLCPIRGRRLDCLIQQGLASILFEKAEC